MSAPTPPPAATPDDKDWTWTTSRACAECGFDPDLFPADRFPAAITDLAERVGVALTRPDASQRPDPSTWSGVEYAHHLADVCEVMTLRLGAILEAPPQAARFASWDGEVAAVEQEYWRWSPAATGELLRSRAAAAATAFAVPVGDQWELRGLRGDGIGFTARSLGLYLLHELVHHAHDVGA